VGRGPGPGPGPLHALTECTVFSFPLSVRAGDGRTVEGVAGERKKKKAARFDSIHTQTQHSLLVITQSSGTWYRGPWFQEGIYFPAGKNPSNCKKKKSLIMVTFQMISLVPIRNRSAKFSSPFGPPWDCGTVGGTKMTVEIEMDVPACLPDWSCTAQFMRPTATRGQAKPRVDFVCLLARSQGRRIH
jgi:hypothetical protein